MSNKPYKGEIYNVRKYEVPEDMSKKYGPNLGYLFLCSFKNHPQFMGERGNTSLVVSYDEETGEVETLNSRYKVIS